MLLFRTLRAHILLALVLTFAPIFGVAAVWAREASERPIPYVRPDFAPQIERLRPEILAAAHRHNRPQISKMSDEEFAVTIAQILYNEHFGWLEDDVPLLRPLTPYYQSAQIFLDRKFGMNFSVWPSNLRPSVAAEILRGEMPVRRPDHILPVAVRVPVRVIGHGIDLGQYASTNARYQAISEEISHPDLAVEYLAANLERGMYRAENDGVSVTWETLAAWHNQGIVAPADIRKSQTASDYIRRAAVYRPLAERLIMPSAAFPSNTAR